MHHVAEWKGIFFFCGKKTKFKRKENKQKHKMELKERKQKSKGLVGCFIVFFFSRIILCLFRFVFSRAETYPKCNRSYYTKHKAEGVRFFFSFFWWHLSNCVCGTKKKSLFFECRQWEKNVKKGLTKTSDIETVFCLFVRIGYH